MVDKDYEHCGECEQPEDLALGPKVEQIYGGWAHRDWAAARVAMVEAGWWFGCLATWRRQEGGTEILQGVIGHRWPRVMRALKAIHVVN